MQYLQSRMNYAVQLFYTAEYEEAKIVLTSLLKAYKKQQAIKQACHCLYQLAHIAYVRGDMQLFARHMQEYQALTATNTVPLLFETEMLQGLQWLSLQRYERALTAFSAAQTAQQSPQQYITAQLYRQKCLIFLDHFQLALQTSETLWQQHEAMITQHTALLFHYQLNRARTLLALDEFEQVKQLLTQYKAHADYTLLPIEHITALVLQAKLQQPHTAITLLQQAHELALLQQDTTILGEIYESFMENYEALNNVEAALLFAKKRLTLNKQLLFEQIV